MELTLSSLWGGMKAKVVWTNEPLAESLSADLADTRTVTNALGSNHPLASLAGKYEGDFWEETLAEIERDRERERLYFASMSTAD